jgi:AcrR family transcriptional regulator
MGGPTGARGISAQATRGAIVSAASRLFFERGYHGTGIDDVAGAAGVAVQTIYNSVGSKRELLVQVLDYADDLLRTGLVEWGLRPTPDPNRDFFVGRNPT